MYTTFCKQDVLIAFLSGTDVCTQAHTFNCIPKRDASWGPTLPTESTLCKISGLALRRSVIMLTWFTKVSSCAQLVVTLHHAFQYVYTTHSNMLAHAPPQCLKHLLVVWHILFKATDCIHGPIGICLNNARSSYLALFVCVLVVTIKTTFYSMVCPPLSLLPCPSCCAFDSFVLCGYLSVAPPLVPHLFLLGMTIITNNNYRGIPPRYREAP